MIFDLISWLVIGLLVGLLARFLVPGHDPMGCLMTSLLGVAGSLLGGFVSQYIFHPAAGDRFVKPGFLVSLLGAILLVLLVRLFRRG